MAASGRSVEKSLTARAGRAFGWSAMGTGLYQVLNGAKTLVLARLLTREDFGLVAVGMMIITGMEALTYTGMRLALLQRQDPSPDAVAVGWLSNVLRSIVLAGTILAIAPLVGDFFHSPNSVPIVRIMAIGTFINGLMSMGPIDYDRKLQLHKSVKVTIAGDFVDAVTAIIAAIILRNAYAIAIGYTARYIVQVIVSFWIHPWRPRLVLNLHEARGLFSYGRWLTLVSIINFLNIQMDKAVVGRLLDVDRLGLYTMAFTLANLPASAVFKLTGYIPFSSYVAIGDDLERRHHALWKFITAWFALLVPVTVLGILFGGTLLPAMLGAKWQGIGPVFNVLLVAAMLRYVVVETISQYLMAIGKPHLTTALNIVRLAAFAGSLYPLFVFAQMQGVALAVLAASIASLIATVVCTRGLIPLRGRPFALLGLNVGLPTTLATLAVIALRAHLPSASVAWICVTAATWLALAAAIYGAIHRWTRHHPQLSLKTYLVGTAGVGTAGTAGE